VGSLASVGYVFRMIEPLFFGTPGRGRAPGGSVAVPGGVRALALAIVLLGIANERVVTVFISPGLAGASP
jgi:hypothetical protein